VGIHTASDAYVLHSYRQQDVIPELRSRVATWNLRGDLVEPPPDTLTPGASPTFRIDGGLHPVSAPSLDSPQWPPMPISPPLSSPITLQDGPISQPISGSSIPVQYPPSSESPRRPSMPISPSLSSPINQQHGQISHSDSGYSISVPYTPPSLFNSSEAGQGNSSRPLSTSTISLDPSTTGSRLTILSTSSSPPLVQTESAQTSAAFLEKVQDGSKSNTLIILAWLRNPEIRSQLDRATLNRALIILSGNSPMKKYG
jgi:hypothetical protein